VPVTASNPFKWRHYPGDIILWCVRWYLRFPISFAHMAEMALERGLLIHSSCIWRWVQIYGPELDQRCRAHLKRTNKSYRVDETYIRIKGQDRYLYRGVDPTGQTIDFLLTAKRSIPIRSDRLMQRQPGDSFVRCCWTQPIRSRG
jgi:transposase, IS6 family